MRTKDLEVTAALREVFQHAFTQGEFEIVGIVDILEAEDGQAFDVKVDWIGFDERESLWEPLATKWDGAPQFAKSVLRKLWLDRRVRSRLQKF